MTGFYRRGVQAQGDLSNVLLAEQPWQQTDPDFITTSGALPTSVPTVVSGTVVVPGGDVTTAGVDYYLRITARGSGERTLNAYAPGLPAADPGEVRTPPLVALHATGQPPLITHTPVLTAVRGQQVPLTWTVRCAAIDVQSCTSTVQWRPLSSAGVGDAPLSAPGGTATIGGTVTQTSFVSQNVTDVTYTATLPAVPAGDLIYWITASDGTSNAISPGTPDASAGVPVQSTTVTAAGYRVLIQG